MTKETYAVVPMEPTEEMWDGLARDLVMWWGFDRPTGEKLYRHLEMKGVTAPDWLRKEIQNVDHVPPKGTVAVCIYKAMIQETKSLQGMGPSSYDGPNGSEIFVVPGYYGNLRNAIRTLIQAVFPNG